MFVCVQLPPTSALIKLLRKPKVEGLRVAVPNPQSLLNKYIMKPCEAVELVHSLLIPLVMERFYLFDMRFAESPRLLIEEATSAAEWCLATRALSRMGRIANYLLTGEMDSLFCCALVWTTLHRSIDSKTGSLELLAIPQFSFALHLSLRAT